MTAPLRPSTHRVPAAQTSAPLRRAGVRRRLHGYVLLETVIATGLLVIGLAVIGTQVQKSYFGAKQMERRERALMLAESKLAELDTGLLEFDSADEIMEEEFGRLFPHYGFRITIEPTFNEDLNHITLEILHQVRDYDRDEFDYDTAEVIQTLHTFRMVERPLDLTIDFGMDEEKVEEFVNAAGDVGVSIDPADWDPRILARLEFEELLSFVPVMMETFGLTANDLQGLPPELRDAIEQFLGEGGGNGDDENGDEGDDGFDEDDEDDE